MSNSAGSWARLAEHSANNQSQLAPSTLERLAPVIASYAHEAPLLCEPGVEPLRLLQHDAYSYPDVDHFADVIRVWVAKSPTFATEMMVAATRFRREWDDEGVTIQDCEAHEGLHYVEWQAFAKLVRELKPADLEEAQASALRLADGAPSGVRYALTIAFPAAHFLTEKEKRAGVFAHPNDPTFNSHFYLLACVSEHIDMTQVESFWDIPILDHVEALGELACGPLRASIASYWSSKDEVRAVTKAIAAFDSQDAADACARLLHKHHAAELAVRRLWAQPAQAVPALARWVVDLRAGPKYEAAARTQNALGALRSILRAYPDAHDSVQAGDPSEAARAVVAAELEKVRRLPPAKPLTCLKSLPWIAKKSASATKTTKAKGSKAAKVAAPQVLAYEEATRFKSKERPTFDEDGQDPAEDEDLIERIRSDDHRSLWQATLLTKPAAIRILAEVEPKEWYASEEDVTTMLVLVGFDALDVLLVICKRLGDCLVGLAAVDSPRVAVLMANAQANLKKQRVTGENWLRRFPEAAAVGLIPALYGKGKPLKSAQSALRFVCEKNEAVVVEVAARYGEDASARITALLGADSSPMAKATTPPKLPKFIRPDMLPAPVLRGGELSLCDEDVINLVRLLSIAGFDNSVVDEVRDSCTEDSLAELAWCVFQQWLLSGAPMKTKWPFFALAHFGDGEAARALGPLAKEWAPGGFPSRAQLAIDVLAAMNTDSALMEIYKTAERVRSKGLARHAHATLTAIASARGLSMEELTDRLVPDLGLEDDGTTTLSYGESRQFQVRFDESLKPRLYGADGKELKSLPRPNRRDDEAMAAEAKSEWSRLKKEAKAIAGERVHQLERAMCEGRTWNRDEFLSFFAQHALLINLAKRIVWSSDEGLFRVCEDGTFADENDEPCELPLSRVGIPHPLRFGASQRSSVETWASLFADYELLQPFAQLGREVHSKAAAAALLETVPKELAATSLLKLRRFGWEEGDTGAGGRVVNFARVIGDATAVIVMDPGIYLGDVQMEPVQQVELSLDDDALLFSEVARDMMRL